MESTKAKEIELNTQGNKKGCDKKARGARTSVEEINTSAEFVSMREKEAKAMLSKETEGCALNRVTAKSHLRPAPRLEDKDVAGTSTVTVK